MKATKNLKHNPLLELAELSGVELSYTDSEGVLQTASEEAILGILRSLDIPIENPDDADEAIQEKLRDVWSQLLEPFSVLWDGVGDIILHLPEAHDYRSYRWIIECDNGEKFKGNGVCNELSMVTTAEWDGKSYVARKIQITEPLPTGYATFTLNLGGRKYRSKLAVAPTLSYYPSEDGVEDASLGQKRRWGVFAPLYSLHSQERPGVGDLGDLEDLTDWVAEQGGEVVGTLPLLASFLDEFYSPSPYSPVTRLYWNELFLDLDTIPEWESCKEARELSKQQSETNSTSEWLDYHSEMAAKRQVLEAMLEHLLSRKRSSRYKAFHAFAKSDKEAARYASFRAANEKRQTPWHSWPKSMQSGTLRKGSYKEEAKLYHLYVQWNLNQQLERLSEKSREKGLGLYLDLALGTHPFGYDTWRHNEIFAKHVATGAPPDPLFRGGQNWGFPPLHPQRLLESQYAYFIECIRNHMKYAGVLRIDHVMGLHRLYWIPNGLGAKEGVYVRYNFEHFYAILSLESHRNKTVLIGEDLGTVQKIVRKRMQQHRIQRMHVQPFANSAMPPLPAVASLNTHDMPMMASFWTGSDIEDRHRLGFLTGPQVEQEHRDRKSTCKYSLQYLKEQGWLPKSVKEEYPASSETLQQVLEASLSRLAASESRLLLINLEDLWHEKRSQNVPGTNDEQNPNWRGRTQQSLEELMANKGVKELLGRLAALREQPVPAVLSQPAREQHPAETQSEAHLPLSSWGEQDRYYFGEGTHDRLYEKLGAHIEVENDKPGVRFRVWAPRAFHVSVVGDFNQWRDEANPMQHVGSGVWETFVPYLEAGQLYKYNIVAPWGMGDKHKFDPMGYLHEEPPRTASVIWDLSYTWNDSKWMEGRGSKATLESPISIYEVHLGSWMRDPNNPERILSFKELAPRLADYVEEMGFTHVELMPIMEHPFFGSWGYQCTGYFAPSRRFGNPQDLMALVDTLHQRNIGVILDWVPSHFPRDDYGLAYYDGTATYEYEDARKGYHPDWTSNIFDYGYGPVQSFLLSSALFWLEYYHIDGLRVDGVASMLYLDYSRKHGEWLPNIYGGRENLEAVETLRRLNATVYRRFPDVQTFAEESTSWPKVSRPVYEDGLGFGLKWDMGWMHDTLQYMSRDPIHRKYHHNELTFRMLYAFHENFVLALSHDEVVHGKGSLLNKMPGDHWQKLAQLRLLYGYMYGMPGKKMLFMGQEFGMGREWDHDTSIDWHLLDYEPHQGLKRWVGDLNRLYQRNESLHTGDCKPEGFQWVVVDDNDNSIFGWMRSSLYGHAPILVYCNFTPVPRYRYRVGVPSEGYWHELANSDAQMYGGSGEGNMGGAHSEPIPSHGWEQSIEITLPPFGVLFFSPEKS